MLSPLEPTLFRTACCLFNGAAGGASGKIWWVTGWQQKELWSRAAQPASPPEVSSASSQKMKPNFLTLLTPLPLHCAMWPTNENQNQQHLNLIHWAMRYDSWRAVIPLCAITFLPQGQKTLMPRQSQQAVVASSPATSSWSPWGGESELLRAGTAGSLGLWRPPRVNHFLSRRADYLVITLCCQKVSDEVRFCESQGRRDMAEWGYEGKTAQRLLTDHVPSIKNN